MTAHRTATLPDRAQSIYAQVSSGRGDQKGMYAKVSVKRELWLSGYAGVPGKMIMSLGVVRQQTETHRNDG